ncbi:MAG: tryptophan--tRNA ligase [bacterium]
MSQKQRIMSGMRPTGKLHIGHYMGVLKNWVELQSQYDCYFAVADWHALTTKFDKTDELKQNVVEVVLDWLACGIDPNTSHIYVQSLVPQTAELHIYLSMITPQRWVERDPTLKDMVKAMRGYGALVDFDEPPENYTEHQKHSYILNQMEKDVLSYGLMGYPVLQSADIMTFNANLVPVGQDQVAHIEITRDIARRFNHIYKTDFFNEPQCKLTKTPMLKGIDGQKMGKSFGNDIKISDDEDTTTKKIMKGITDANRIKREDPGQVDNCEVIYPYYQIFTDKATCAAVKSECESAIRGCADCKRQLAAAVNEYFRPIRLKRTELEQNMDYVYQVIKVGSQRASQEAQKTIEQVRRIVKMY